MLRRNQRYRKLFEGKEKTRAEKRLADGGEPGPFHHQPQIETSTLIALEPTFNSPPSSCTQ
ncbi:hypothetical protein N7489_003164 [Penicillium chrysogenum]|uniref:Uncharacterized protein n=1 Tax=Penicillium chrysogenum TaxID=5076 RepID=A0ABQ8W7S8_PENCH|nr:uncharacterized protein N7489_003164 [Penicillium chrysogenum]KAJ5252754.1 hypothetical protein N7489_003164 [Penicillium chrysogenum]KAJ5254094.1 hypothetical protein N7524_011274 [Penicillium chrysogenum]KAJ5259988.1 hypothetical protein N7505_009369 [Penicillium chrysogenum]KAJ6142096.1 hypothetical protein N7497_011195 [Penicillium chrysogenum]